MAYAVLEITDGTTTYNLLTGATKRLGGVSVSGWKPQVPWYKGEGSWADSPIADGRIPVFGRRDNVRDVFPFTLRARTPDKLAWMIQELVRLLEKGNEYWLATYALDPVWLKAQSTCESEPRYALIYRATIPEIAFPYGNGILSLDQRAVMQDLTLAIEHSPWLSAPPLSPECVMANTLRASHYVAYWNAEGRYANCGSDAGLDNLADAAFTIDGWFCPDAGDYGDGLSGVLVEKGTSGGTGWSLRLDSLWGLKASVRCAVMEAYSSSGLDDYTADGLWHHIAMTFNDAGDRKIRLLKDGTEVASYVAQNAGNGAIIADAAFDFAIGDAAVSLATNFHGKIGWVRASDTVLFAASYTVPPRCTIPTPTINTQAIWGGEGYSTTLYNQEGTTGRDGTITDSGTPPLPLWGFDCDNEFGRADTCEEENYVSTQYTPYQLTHVVSYDVTGATWTANILGTALPYALLPAIPAAGDCVYFGIEGSVPFSNVVFDLGDVATSNDVVWEEHGGAINANTWNAIALAHDATNLAAAGAFTNPGVHAYTFQHSANWTVGDLQQIFGGGAPAVPARWIRARVATAWVGDTPTQQNRQPYAVARPWVDVAAENVPGDIPMLLRAEIVQDAGSGGAGIWDEMILALRSYDRDSDLFQAIINLCDFGNLDHITVTPVAPAAFANDASATLGRVLSYTSAGAGSARIVDVSIAAAQVPEFSGVFRLFTRLSCATANPGTIYYDTPYPYAYTGAAQQVAVLDWQLVDLGILNVPPRLSFGEPLVIRLFITDTLAAQVYNLHDLWLVPVDEMAVRLKDSSGLGTLTDGFRFVVDDMTYPREGTVGWLGDFDSDAWRSALTISLIGDTILQANKHQRVYVFHITYAGVAVASSYSMLAKIKLSGLARYLTLRGVR